jgi:hypothetical protein
MMSEIMMEDAEFIMPRVHEICSDAPFRAASRILCARCEKKATIRDFIERMPLYASTCEKRSETMLFSDTRRVGLFQEETIVLVQ